MDQLCFYRSSNINGVRKVDQLDLVGPCRYQILHQNEEKLIIYTCIVETLRQTTLIAEYQPKTIITRHSIVPYVSFDLLLVYLIKVVSKVSGKCFYTKNPFSYLVSKIPNTKDTSFSQNPKSFADVIRIRYQFFAPNQ